MYAVHQDVYFRGCYRDPDNLVGETLATMEPEEEGEDSMAELACRTVCVNSDRKPYALIMAHEKCVCLDSMDRDQFTDNCMYDSWVVYAAWGLNNRGIALSMIAPDMVLINETAHFTVTTELDVPLELEVSFGDNTSIVSFGPDFEHEWVMAGEYSVEVRATHLDRTEVQTAQVKVTRMPVPLKIGAFRVAVDSSRMRGTTAKVAVSGDPPLTCELQFAKNAIEVVENEFESIAVFELKHAYDFIGNKTIQATCSNLVNNESLSGWVEASDVYYTTLYEKMLMPIGSEIELYLSQRPIKLTGAMDTQKVRFLNQDIGNVTISDDTFRCPGYHFLSLTSDFSRWQYTVHMEENIEDLVAFVDKTYTIAGSSIELTVTTTGGSNFAVAVEFGDGTQHSATVPVTKGPSNFSFHHSYTEAGTFPIRVKAANMVSSKTIIVPVYIEEILSSFFVETANISSLTDPVVFTLQYFTAENTPIPAWVEFDYNNGETEAFRNEVLDGPLLHKHIYPEYGIYRIHIVVRNNISQLETDRLVQVGRNITYVGVYADSTYITTGEDVKFSISCPYGAPVVYKIDYGNGEASTIKPDLWKVKATPEEVISVHTYKKPGVYKVKVTAYNNVTRQEAYLCHDIEVADADSALAGCIAPQLKFPSTRYSQDIHHPHNLMKSANMSLLADIAIDCEALNKKSKLKTVKPVDPILEVRANGTLSAPDMLNSTESSFEIFGLSYAWRAFEIWNVSGVLIRNPVTELCHVGGDISELTLEPRQLPYGLYDVRLTASVPGGRGLRESVSFFLNVGKSPLVPVISDQRNESLEEREVFIKDALVINFRKDSFDPDFEKDNKTDMTFDLICVAGNDTDHITETNKRVLVENEVVTFWDYNDCFNLTDDLTYSDGIFRIPAINVFEEITVTLHMYKDNRRASTKQKIYISLTAALNDLENMAADLEKALSGDANKRAEVREI